MGNSSSLENRDKTEGPYEAAGQRLKNEPEIPRKMEGIRKTNLILVKHF